MIPWSKHSFNLQIKCNIERLRNKYTVRIYLEIKFGKIKVISGTTIKKAANTIANKINGRTEKIISCIVVLSGAAPFTTNNKRPKGGVARLISKTSNIKTPNQIMLKKYSIILNKELHFSFQLKYNIQILSELLLMK